MATYKPFVTSTVDANNTVVDAKLKPGSLLELLIGGPYTQDGILHRYGHTALRIKKPSKEFIYDFGRYGKIYPEKVALGYELKGQDSPRGEGILKIWTNFDAYIASENSYGRVTWGYKYWIFDVQADLSIAYYQNLIKGREPIRKTPTSTQYKLQTDYFALGPNCTTLSIDGAKAAIPRIDEGSEKFIDPDKVLPAYALAAMKLKYGNANRIFLPDNLKTFLDAGSKIRIDERKTYGGK